MRVFISIAFTIFTFTLIVSPYIMGADARRMVGGYSTVNTKSEEIDRAAQLVLQKLQEGSGPSVSYSSELQTISKTKDESLVMTQSLKAVPLEASQQVVAGMNYKMKVGIFIETSGNTKPGSSASREVLNSEKHKKCIGGISVTVYRDLKGEYSVTTWGSEIGCDQVVALMNENKGEE